MRKAAAQTMSLRSQGARGSGSSGHLWVRRVMKATTGSTTSSRYFSTTAGVWCWSQVPQTEPVRDNATAGAKSFQSTSP